MSYRLLSLADKYEKKANDTILCIPLFLSKFADRRTYEQDASATCAVANIRLASHSTSLPPSRSLSLSMSVCLRLCLDIAACRQLRKDGAFASYTCASTRCVCIRDSNPSRSWSLKTKNGRWRCGGDERRRCGGDERKICEYVVQMTTVIRIIMKK